MALGLGASLNTVRKTTLSGMVTSGLVLKQNYDTGAVVPISDGAAYFDGSDDYVDLNATFQTTLAGALTVTAWIKPDDGQPSATEVIFGSSSASDEDRFYFMLQSTGKLGILYKSNGQAGNMEDDSTSAVFADGSTDWTHVALTLTESGGTVTGGIYVNGTSIAGSFSGAGTMANFVTPFNLYIGAANRNTSGDTLHFAGNICNAGIFSSVLTAAQIKSIMYKNYSGLTTSEKTNLVSWWNLSALHVDGSTVVDSHGSNNGTLS